MSALSAMFLCGSMAFAQDTTEPPVMNNDPGNGWTDQSEPLILNLNFQNYEHFHSQENANAGNSRHSINPDVSDPEDPNYVILGYKDMVDEVNFVGSSQVAVLDFYQCAFAPEWKTAYAFRDGETGANTPNVSDGFVEIGRSGYNHNDIPHQQGYFTIDLGEVDFISSLQYTVSSAGGDRRGFTLEYSLDGGAVWDTLRYQPSDSHYTKSFNVTDMYANERTPNGYRGTNSGYGLVWQDDLNYLVGEGEHFMVRFTIGLPNNQVVRVHDFKVYGDLKTASSVASVGVDGLGISLVNDKVFVTQQANVSVYSIAGSLLKNAQGVTELGVADLPTGIYVVKAVNEQASVVQKVMKK